MSSRLIINGRPVWSNEPRGKRIQNDETPFQPIGYLDLNPANRDFVDGPYKLRYRLVDAAVPPDEWLTFPQLQSLLGCTDRQLKEMVSTNILEVAMVRGSGIPLFRVVQRAKALAMYAIQAPKREKKVRWDK